MDISYGVITFISKHLYFKKAGAAIFHGIIKIVTIFVKETNKDSRKIQRTRSYVSKSDLYLYFLI